MTYLTILAATFLSCALPSALAVAGESIPFKFWIGAPAEPDRMSIRLHGAVRLPAAQSGIHELSGLTWDADDKLLYAVSDAGYIVHLAVQISAGVLNTITVKARYPILNENGDVPRPSARDAEGLAGLKTRNGVVGDAELLISFEQVPRLARYDISGRFLGYVVLPPQLLQVKAYDAPNRGLEALTIHPDYGSIVVPERPLADESHTKTILYSGGGRSWQIPALDARYGTVSGLETMPDGRLLLLERRFTSFLQPIQSVLRRINLESTQGGLSSVEELARFDSSKGWAIDNFESVAWHSGQHYFMVSDDNASAFQNTVFVYFEIAP
jgi:hypothetical protein